MGWLPRLASAALLYWIPAMGFALCTLTLPATHKLNDEATAPLLSVLASRQWAGGGLHAWEANRPQTRPASFTAAAKGDSMCARLSVRSLSVCMDRRLRLG